MLSRAQMRGVKGFAAFIGASVFLLVAAASLKWYLWDIVVGESGEADRSMLFWGLPIVFAGLGAMAAGIGLAVVARRSLSGRR